MLEVAMVLSSHLINVVIATGGTLDQTPLNVGVRNLTVVSKTLIDLKRPPNKQARVTIAFMNVRIQPVGI